MLCSGMISNLSFLSVARVTAVHLTKKMRHKAENLSTLDWWCWRKEPVQDEPVQNNHVTKKGEFQLDLADDTWCEQLFPIDQKLQHCNLLQLQEIVALDRGDVTLEKVVLCLKIHLRVQSAVVTCPETAPYSSWWITLELMIQCNIDMCDRQWKGRGCRWAVGGCLCDELVSTWYCRCRRWQASHGCSMVLAVACDIFQVLTSAPSLFHWSSTIKLLVGRHNKKSCRPCLAYWV